MGSTAMATAMENGVVVRSLISRWLSPLVASLSPAAEALLEAGVAARMRRRRALLARRILCGDSVAAPVAAAVSQRANLKGRGGEPGNTIDAGDRVWCLGDLRD